MAKHAVQLTLRSSNVKTGPIPVSTTSSDSCPPSCPLRGAGCYAEGGNVGMVWRKLSATKPGDKYQNGVATLQSMNWHSFCDAVEAMPEGTLWRHNQAGDLPGNGDAIDTTALAQLVAANKGKRGFTFSHKPVTGKNAKAIAAANAAGFTINLSADNLAEADMLAETGAGPVVVVLPSDTPRQVTTPAGRKVAQCPATYMENVTCASCQLCQRQERKVIVGFPAHGASHKKASAVARG